MRVTIDTFEKTITIHGSFTYSEFQELRTQIEHAGWGTFVYTQPSERTDYVKWVPCSQEYFPTWCTTCSASTPTSPDPAQVPLFRE